MKVGMTSAATVVTLQKTTCQKRSLTLPVASAEVHRVDANGLSVAPTGNGER